MKKITFPKLRSALILSSVLGFTACSTPSTKPEVPAKVEPKVEVTAIEAPTSMEVISPEEELAKALQKGDWESYLRFSNEIWQESANAIQQQIEQDVWQQIRFLDTETLTRLQNAEPNIQAWADLVRMTQTKGFEQLNYQLDLTSFHAEAPFQKHLYPSIIQSLPAAPTPKMIAAFLPESGKYKLIGEFIKNGILKSYYATQSQENPLRLKFYDSADITKVIQLYYQAKLDGADFIIGPVQKEAIELLSSLDDENLLALNSIDQASVFTQFNLRQNFAQKHLLSTLDQLGYQTLALFASNEPKQQQAAQSFAKAWQSDAKHNLVQQDYASEELNFREALGKLLNESASVERKNALRWIVGAPLEFFPRVRQDLDAILMLDNAQKLSVFNPQLDFYQLKTPVFADDALRPKSIQQIQTNPDLAGITLLNPPYALAPLNLANMFEAFGWDSLLLATQMSALKNGGCVTAGKTGILSLDGFRIDQQLIWTQYNTQGELKPYQFPAKIPADETLDNVTLVPSQP